MQYDVGRIGRVIVARGYDGENVYAGIEQIAARENIASGVVIVVGGLRRGKVVVGPKNLVGPPEPMFREFDDAREIAGVGTIFSDETGPKLHLHGAIGRGDDVIAGCLRGGANVFCVLEIVIIEMEGLTASRSMDPEYGLKLLALVGAGVKSI